MKKPSLFGLLNIAAVLLTTGCANHKKFTVYVPVPVPTPDMAQSSYEQGCTEALKRVGAINTEYRHLLEKNGVKPSQKNEGSTK